MPYITVDDIPNYVKKYSPRIQRQWMHVWNSVYNRILKETKSKQEAEQGAFKAANSVLLKRMEKHGSYGINTHGDYFSYLTDKWLKLL